MEIFELLESLEDILERSRNLPFSSKGIVDKDEILDLIKEGKNFAKIEAIFDTNSNIKISFIPNMYPHKQLNSTFPLNF